MDLVMVMVELHTRLSSVKQGLFLGRGSCMNSEMQRIQGPIRQRDIENPFFTNLNSRYAGTARITCLLLGITFRRHLDENFDGMIVER